MKQWLLLACLAAASAVQAQDKQPNIIYVIGDGMGMEFVSAYRYFQDDRSTPDVERTLFDKWLVGTASTSPHDHDTVTDSAAAATALASGVKTYNGAIGLDNNKEPVETVLEFAKKQGYSTGMVATSQINHATPASFAAHTESRHNYNEIADQYLDNRHRGAPFVDVLIGGGQQYFKREDRDLVKDFSDEGYGYTEDLKALADLTDLPALALLADISLGYALDSDQPQRLSQMADKAIQLLSSKQPFFLMIEASLIDWCGHANDIACAMAEMTDAENALEVIKRFADANPNTVVVVTADHSTGGLSMGVNGKYEWHPERVRAISATVPEITQRLLAAEPWQKEWDQLTDLSLSRNDVKRVEGVLKTAREAEGEEGQKLGQAELTAVVLDLINTHTATGWTTGGHTGGDVPVMAYGKHRERFVGNQDNTEIALKLFDILGRKKSD